MCSGLGALIEMLMAILSIRLPTNIQTASFMSPPHRKPEFYVCGGTSEISLVRYEILGLIDSIRLAKCSFFTTVISY